MFQKNLVVWKFRNVTHNRSSIFWFQKNLVVWKFYHLSNYLTYAFVLFQKNLVVWKYNGKEGVEMRKWRVSEELSSMEIVFLRFCFAKCKRFQKNLVVWK